MARRDGPVDDGTALRAFLLAEAEDFCKVLCVIDPQFWAELSKPVDALVGGEPYTLHRWELTDDHPARLEGPPCDLLVLGRDDRLRLYDDVHSPETQSSS